ncbi:helix-turn-helix domain-containing protein [Vibrio antiquarius]|uniref:helix-turn-helix domain-containing protein n=1 Tax=Vibrio harveyi group TaxID=717610 RepID=UPI000996C9AD|nr:MULTISPECIES: helix-turn-helix domain-containing protein [Vibrio harveyi group]MCR9684321.1 helix-turn-helix domain-containing protein [Vibrio antiquarius]MDL2006869.1 helix-turn-helix domain-containing protein [Vibrio parahaemolyticus]OOX27365.1 IclR family transcriptional regulator [Vibrio parahaemolyticus]
MKSKFQNSISGYNLKPTRLALDLLEIMVSQGVEGMSLKQLGDHTGIPKSSLHRYLQVLVDSGWIDAVGEQKNMLWKPSNHFIKLAFSYRNAVRAQVQAIESEFKDLTGEEL